MIAASQAGSRREVKGGVGFCSRYRRVRSAPWDATLPCLMQPARTCEHLLLSCFAWTAQCSLPHVLLGVCTHNMLWAVVCPGAPCTDVRTLRACTHDVRTSSMLGTILFMYRLKLSSLFFPQDCGKLVNLKMMRNPWEGICSVSCSQSINLLLSFFIILYH